MQACTFDASHPTDEHRSSPLILIIDDDPVFRLALEEVLSLSGPCRIMAAEDSVAGTRLFLSKSREIDVITLDLSMPNRDGVQVLRSLSESGFHGRLVLISGESSRIVESAGRLASMLGLEQVTVFSKPVDFSEVSRLVFAKAKPTAIRQKISKVDAEEINSALRESRLFAACQPRINLVTGELTGAEALARMRNTKGELVDAGQMINLAENNGKIADITWRIVEIICEDYPIFLQDQAPGFRMSFNISGSILSNPQFADQLADLFRLSGMKPETSRSNLQKRGCRPICRAPWNRSRG